MPRASKVSKQPEVVSPSRPQRYGSKQLAENLSKDELLKRLKKIAKELSEADQDKKLEEYAETAASLAKPFILKHPDKDVRLYAAFCLVNLLRIFVPNHPYDRNQLWSIFNLTIGMLEGLRNPKGSSFEKLFSILECLAFTKTVNICLQMDFSDLILKLFKTLFNSIRPEHSKKVIEYMLDMMSTILNEAESVSQELLDTILENIVNPKKTSHQYCCNLATLLLKRTAPAIEPYIQLFFHNALFFDKASDSQLFNNLYDVVYELFKICPSVLLSVLPQLEFKLKSNVESERLEVTKMLGNMFADENSDLAQSHKPLWQCYLGRFVDINPNVRVECTKHAKYFFVNHPELVDDISEKLHGRQRDPDEKVRMEVVTTICEAASENVTSVSEKLFEVVTERLRDRKLHIRKDTMMSLGRLYKKILGSDVNNNDMKKISWIPTKILHCYYQNSPEDRLCVERVFLGCLVPVTLGSKERVRRMLTLYQKLDAPATKAFNHMLKSQASLRSDLSEILRYWQEHQKRNSEESKKRLTVKISMIAKVLPDPAKTQEHLKKLVQMLSDKKLFELMTICVGSGQECSKVSKAVSEVAIKFGAKNPLFETVKALLDRGAPLLFDSSAGKQLVTLVSQCVDDENIDGEDDTEDDDRDEDEISVNGRKALDLLLTCATAFPSDFNFSLIFEKILVYLKRNDFVADVALQILTHIGQSLEEVDSRLMSYYQQALTKLFTTGAPSQVKLAGCAINKIFSNPLTIFERILENQLDCLDSESSTLISTLSCLGQIALLAPNVFEKHNTTVIRDFVVKDLLMKDKGKSEKGSALWCEESELSKEIKAKIQGVKLLVNWLRGLQTKDKAKVQPVLRILDNVLKKDGDMTGRSRVRPCEMSYMRLTAACGLLKLCQESAYHEFIDIEYFMNLSSIMQDPCTHVRAPFAKKLCKGLESMKLPLEYLTLFALSAKESSKDRRQQVKQMICRCINVRNEYLKQHSSAAAHSASVLPEYALPYLIYLLSHRANVDYSEVESLKDIKTYLWFFMEPILARGDNYNFMKKLAENVKQTKDARAPNDVDANNAIYTVCDIAIGIILNLSKTQTFLLKDFPGNLVLPKKLFVPLGKGEGNSKSYLPKDFLISPVKKTSNNVSKITPSKPVHSSSSANKKKPSQTTKRVSDTHKIKKTQRALMDILEKETTESSEELSEEEEEIPRKKTGPTRKEATKKTSPQKSQTSARKRSSETANHQDEKRSRKVSASPMKEENPTRSSPRKNVKSSTSVENIVKNTRVSETEGALMDILGKETNESSEELSEDEEEIPREKTDPTRKETRQNPPPQETLTSPAKTRSSETVNHQDEGRSKKVSKSPMKEENPTRSSPRKNVKSSTSVENIVRNTRTKDLSDEATEPLEQSELVSPEPQSPVKKRKTVEEVNPKEPLEQSSLNIKRRRRR